MTGSSILDGAEFRFVPGPIFSQVVLVDEINRATPRTQAALLEAMQERQVSVDGETRPLPEPFIVLATQNPIELEGTFALPEAQLDRFLLRIAMGYPSATPSTPSPAATRPRPSRWTGCRRSLMRRRSSPCARTVRTVRVADGRRGATWSSLVRATREHADVRLGASPRSSVALYRAAQAWAALEGRDFVLPDDVRAVAHAVLDHRILLDLDRELRGATVERRRGRGPRRGAGPARRMTGWTALALATALIGVVAGVPGLLLLAVATFAYGATTRLWTRYGLTNVELRAAPGHRPRGGRRHASTSTSRSGTARRCRCPGSPPTTW